MVSKLGFIVEDKFYLKHVGVRNLIFSLYQLFQNHGYTVDFIKFKRVRSGLIWSKLFLSNQSIQNNFCTVDKFSCGSSKQVFNDYKSNSLNETHSNIDDNVVEMPIGNDINIENYDMLLITTPWLVVPEMSNLKSKMAGIVYDMIPNDYCLSDSNRYMDFASHHTTGYDFYVKNCEIIFTISEYTRNSFLSYYPLSQEKIHVIPTPVPVYLNHQKNRTKKSQSLESINNKKNIILGNPLDPRKGLEGMPSLINSIKNDINKVFIYGAVRCSYLELKKFFNSIDSNIKIVWYQMVTVKTLSNLFYDSELLIFPSINEGLGLPIIEAQLHGCKVITTKFESAYELLVEGTNMIEDLTNYDLVKQSLVSYIDRKTISKEAELKYKDENKISSLIDLINNLCKLPKKCA